MTDRLGEGISVGTGRHQHEPGCGAQLAARAGQRGDELFGHDACPVACQGTVEQDDRVDRAHLRIDGNGNLPCLSGRLQGQSAGAGTREADGGDPGIGDESLTDRGSRSEDEGEHSGVETVGGDRLGDGAADDLPGSGVGVVGLDDDGAAGGERGGGVTAGDGEGEREVAGAEDDDGADGDLALPDVQPRCRGTVRLGGVDAGGVEVPGPDHLGEESQLSDGTADFTGQPCRGQPGLGHGTVDDRFAHGFDVVRDRLEEGGALGRRGRPVAG